MGDSRKILGYSGSRTLDDVLIQRVTFPPAITSALNPADYPGLMNWGGHASGDALLALLILLDFTDSISYSLSTYPAFMHAVIAPQSGNEILIHSNTIIDFIARYP